MKRFFLLLIAVIMLITVSGISFASNPTPVNVYMWGEDGWQAPKSCLGVHARAFVSGPAGGMCDKEVWTENISTNVSVSQWISYCFSGTRWDWQIRKPGTFAADCICFCIQSNDDVQLTFSGFDNLKPEVHDGATPINVWYGFGDLCAGPPADWAAATALNDINYTFSYADISQGIVKKLWNKIEILGTTRACNYGNTGTITLTLTDVKPFIDRVTGDYL